GAQGWYDLYLGIAPNTSPNDTLYIGGIEAYYSFNSGTNWTAYSSYQINGLHVDNQSIALDPFNSRNVLVGTDGGIYLSASAGQVNTWSYRSNGFETVRFYHIGLDKNSSSKTYGGAQDQAEWKTTTGQAAQQLFFGDAFQPIIDPNNSNTMYAEGPFGDVWKNQSGGAFQAW